MGEDISPPGRKRGMVRPDRHEKISWRATDDAAETHRARMITDHRLSATTPKKAAALATN